MRYGGTQIPGFLSGPKTERILVFGTAEGYAGEVVARLCAGHVCTILDAGEVASDPQRLAALLESPSLFCERSAVRIRSAGDKLTKILSEILGGPAVASPVRLILEAGDLKGKSSLRKLFSESKTAAALNCALLDRDSIEKHARAVLADAGKVADAEARTILAERLPSDPGAANRELQKILDYLGDQNVLSREEAAALVGAGGEAMIDEVVDHALFGRPVAALSAARRLLQSGTSAILLLRSLLNQIDRLQHVATSVQISRVSSDTALRSLPGRPPFGPAAAALTRLSPRLSLRVVDALIMKCLVCEQSIKRSVLDAELLVSHCVLEVSVICMQSLNGRSKP